MAVDLFANAANTILTAGIAAGATSLTVASSTPFPAVSVAAGTQFRVIIDAELFIVTNVTGLTWTVTPGAEGTTQAAHAISAPVTAIATAAAVGLLTKTGMFGSGLDGTATISTTVTAAKDQTYQDLTITATGILNMNGYRLFVAGTLTVVSGGLIHADCANANGNNATQWVGGGMFQRAGVGGGSNSNAAGTAGNVGISSGQLVGGVGGAGGSGSGGTLAGGAGGSVQPGFGGATASNNALSTQPFMTTCTGIYYNNGNPQAVAITGGAGGGGGGGDATPTGGGGGGGGGGVLLICARTVVNNGTIRAKGGDGANRGYGTNPGGGGGGGGGLVIVNYLLYSGTQPTAPGGAAGTGLGTGVAGSAGSAGTVIMNVLS